MGRSQKARWNALAGAVLLAIAIVPVQAQDQEDLQRGVARISLINGDVSVRRGDSGEWVAAAVNAPLMTADQISTGPNSRAEIQFDASNVLRIGGNAQLQLTQLESARYQMEIGQGIVTFTVIRPSGINIEVDTPSVSIKPSRQGVYRISVNEAGETQIICRSGEVEVFTPRGSQWVASGQMLMARGTDGNPEYQTAAAPALDEWDRWNQSRDQTLTQSNSYRNVPPGVYGVEELDQHGDWVNDEDYGTVWHPRGVQDDWSPYSVGRWAWQDWYGWTWVSGDPWGWAPYHYGRWYSSPRFGWCWYPGAFGARHYWSPAQVAFIGFGRGGGVGFGFGNVGWVPLAPREPFNRWWGRGYYGSGFNRNINITNVNIYNNYRNARARNGIAGMAEGDFRSGRFNQVRRYSGDQVREAGLVRGQMPIAPNNAHLRFSDREAGNSARINRANTANTQSFRQQRPSPAARTPFSQQQRAMEQGLRGQQSGGQSVERGQDPGNGWRRFGNPNGQNASPGNAARQDSRFGGAGSVGRIPDGNRESPRAEAPARGQAPQNRENRGGWQRFGDPGSAPRPGPVQPQRRSFQNDSPQQDAPAQRMEQRPMRPSVVRERPAFDRQDTPGGDSPRPGFNRQEASPQAVPRQESPRQFGGGGDSPRPNFNRQESQRQASPRQESPRQFGGGGDSPRPNFNRQESPRQASPRQESPRQFGGGGGQQRGGGNREMSAPRGMSGGGNSRSFGGGGASRSQSGGSPSPRSSGGGGGNRGNGGGGGNRGRR